MNTANKLSREHRQLLNKSASETKCCYFLGCDRSPIHAHSISNKRLILKLSDDGDVMTINKDPDRQDFSALSETGRRKATTFSGFCGDHDKIFNPIDNADFVIGNTEQEFLFAMRASAKEFNTRQTIGQSIRKRLNGDQNLEFPLDEEGTEIMRLFQQCFGASDKDLKENRSIFVDTFKKSKHNVIQTDVIVADGELPIAVSSSFHLELTPSGVLINDILPSGFDTKMKSWFFTVFPQNGKTYCLISYFRKHRNSFKFVEKIALTNNTHKQIVISNLITAYTENFVANPTYWRSLPSETRQKYNKLFGNSFEVERTPFIADGTFNLFPID